MKNYHKTKLVYTYAIVIVIIMSIITICSIFTPQTDEKIDNNQPAILLSSKSTIKEEIVEETKIKTETKLKTMNNDIIHYIESGDTLWGISKKYYGVGTYYTSIAIYNGIEETSILKIGSSLKIPSLTNNDFIQIINYSKSANKESVNNFNYQMAGKVIAAGKNNGYRYGKRSNPAVDITVPSGTDMRNCMDNIDTSEFISIGKYSITGYTPSCEHCCENTNGIGASGVNMICGYSVAAPDHIAFGTTLYIEGYGFYVVEDRGNFGDSNIDIACPTHNDCYKMTASNVNIYIVPNN